MKCKKVEDKIDNDCRRHKLDFKIIKCYKQINKFMQDCGLILENEFIGEEQIISYTTTIELNSEYLEQIEKSLLSLKDDEYFVSQVELVRCKALDVNWCDKYMCWCDDAEEIIEQAECDFECDYCDYIEKLN